MLHRELTSRAVRGGGGINIVTLKDTEGFGALTFDDVADGDTTYDLSPWFLYLNTIYARMVYLWVEAFVVTKTPGVPLAAAAVASFYSVDESGNRLIWSPIDCVMNVGDAYASPYVCGILKINKARTISIYRQNVANSVASLSFQHIIVEV